MERIYIKYAVEMASGGIYGRCVTVVWVAYRPVVWQTSNGQRVFAVQYADKQTSVSKQRLCKHVPAATDTHAKVEVLLECNSGKSRKS
jgi:hypothetical protein